MKTSSSLSRKQIIASTALKLFARSGYEHVSTQLLAKEAGVSEALIFKHFGTKEHLLTSIITAGYQRIAERIRGRLADDDPLALLHQMIDLPQQLVQAEPDFWKLQARLSGMEFARKQHARFLQPLPGLMRQAFERLGYAQPELEARLLSLLVEALWRMEATNSESDTLVLLQYIKTKYRRQQ